MSCWASFNRLDIFLQILDFDPKYQFSKSHEHIEIRALKVKIFIFHNQKSDMLLVIKFFYLVKLIQSF